MLNNVLMYEDDFIKVIYREDVSNDLIITFTNMTVLAKGLNFYAEAPLVKSQLSAIGFMAKKPNWYPQASMQAAYLKIKDILGQYARKIGYGGSMGGYGVIKYSKLLQLDRVVALDPQFSIDAVDIDDHRYSQYFNASIHQGMKITVEDISPAAEYYIFYDPYLPLDKAHMEMIRSVVDDVYVVPVKFALHSSTAILANTSMLNFLFFGDLRSIETQQRIRQMKRLKPNYLHILFKQIFKKDPKRLLYILENTHLSFDALEPNFKNDFLRFLFKSGFFKSDQIEKLGLLTQLKAKYLRSSRKSLLVFNILSNRFETYYHRELKGNPYLLPVLAKKGLIVLDVDGRKYVVCCTESNDVMLLDYECFEQEQAFEVVDENGVLTVTTQNRKAFISTKKNGCCAVTDVLHSEDGVYSTAIF